MKKRMLVLAHREELLDQARSKILHANPGLSVDIEQAGRIAKSNADVVVASVQTLGRKGSARIDRFDLEDFYLVVVDEAHHSIASTYTRVLEKLGVLLENTKKLLVGFTATPKRGDGQGLDKVFDEIVFSRTLPEMITAKYLAPVAGYRIETNVDLSDVKMRLGDFVTSHLSQTVNIEARNDLVIKIHKDYLAERQTICFCVDVAHTLNLRDTFCSAGIAAASVTGDMRPEDRRKTLSDFSEGRVKVLTNCMVLTEGYDESSIAGIILARPTRSSLLYTQMIGRGTRLHPGKKDVLIIDVVDVTKDHSLVTLPSLFGLSDQFDLEGNTTTQVEEALRWVERNRPWVRVDLASSLTDLRYRCRRINLLDLHLPPELAMCSEFAWTAVGSKTYRLGLADGESVLVSSTILSKWEAVLRSDTGESVVAEESNPQTAIRKAEQFVTKTKKESVGLVLRGTKWREEPASEKQSSLINRYNLDVPEGLTKGEASHIIAMLSSATRRAPGNTRSASVN